MSVKGKVVLVGIMCSSDKTRIGVFDILIIIIFISLCRSCRGIDKFHIHNFVRLRQTKHQRWLFNRIVITGDIKINDAVHNLLCIPICRHRFKFIFNESSNFQFHFSCRICWCLSWYTYFFGTFRASFFLWTFFGLILNWVL